MSVEVRVMCGACGRPQGAGLRCVVCGAPLPSSPVPPAGALPDGVELSLAQGFRYVFGEGVLRLRGRRAPELQVPLASIRGARVERRPVLELWPPLLAVLVLEWLLKAVWAKLVALVLLGALVGATASALRAVLVLRLDEGRELSLPLGTLFRGLPGVKARVRRWESLVQGLLDRGVGVEP